MKTTDIDISLTQEAIAKAIELQRDFPRYQNRTLRIYIEGKGCDGFTYGVTFDDKTETDLVFHQGPLNCVIDPESYQFCKGSTVEWVDDERGTGFLLSNPNERHYRGKFYKKRVWQEFLTKKEDPKPSHI